VNFPTGLILVSGATGRAVGEDRRIASGFTLAGKDLARPVRRRRTWSAILAGPASIRCRSTI
jgi:hypothetical protein